jgi:adhesin transport system membrane fusion protein
MNGVVNKVNVDAQGQVVSSGEDVIEIIPIDESLLVQANVRPEDIGDVHSDQRALVKFTAYDFIRYGGMEGTVEYIGADTVTNEKGETYYPIRIRTESNTMGTRDGRDLSIIPGMVADVDLLAGKKSVLEYLLTPVNRARERALKEQ